MGMRNVGLTARVHFMARTPVIFAHGNEQATEFGGCGFGKGTHVLNELAGFGAGLLAKSLVGDGHEFFSVDVVNHADGGVLRGFAAVIIGLPVVALGFDIRMSVDMAAKMNTHPRWALYVEAVAQIADGGVARFKDAVLPVRVGRGDGALADGDESAAFAFEPVAFCWITNEFYVHLLLVVSFLARGVYILF